ncbi:MAG: permease, partial [Candidatus Eremiobacteraeota bacterium]|nr:permease [Candidatus Eremiobacteraeota bacterium]
MSATTILLVLLGLVSAVFVAIWVRAIRSRGWTWPKPIEIAIGFVTNFFDTLGIGSFAPTVSAFKFMRLVPDERIPGTLKVGHMLPTLLEALVFIAIVAVNPLTLYLLIAAAIAGAWLGAGVVAKWPRRLIQYGMGAALIAAAILFTMKNLNLFPGGGTALALEGTSLVIGVVVNFCLGAFMTVGIGLYAPCMILVSLLGMSPATAFPIMMGSCAFLMPVAGIRFIRLSAYEVGAALGLTIGGMPGVLLAAFIVKSLPLLYLRWLVVLVVIVAAGTMI